MDKRPSKEQLCPKRQCPPPKLAVYFGAYVPKNRPSYVSAVGKRAVSAA